MVGFLSGVAGGATVAITIKAIDEFSGTFNKAEGAMRTLSSAFKLGTAAMVAAGVALAGVAISSVKAAADMEAAQLRLEHILKTSRGATDEQVEALYRQAEALQQVGVVSAKTTIVAQGQLATFDLQAESIAALTPAILDYAVAEKGASVSTDELKALTNGLAQALGGNFASLTSTGFVLDDVTKELISTGTETEKVAALVQVLNSTYEGMNETARNTAQGGFIAFKNEITSLQEELGTLLLPIVMEFMEILRDDLLPAIKPLIPVFVDLIKKAIEPLLPKLPRIIDNFVRLVEFTIRLFDALMPLMEPLMELSFVIMDAFLEVMEPILPLVEELAVLFGEVLIALMPLLPPIIDIIKLIVDMAIVIGQILVAAVNAVLPFLESWWQKLSVGIGWIKEVVNWVKILIDWLGKISFGMFDKLGIEIDKNFGTSSSTSKTLSTVGASSIPVASSPTQVNVLPTIRLNDFIMHPNEKIIQPNPNDTIMGFKGNGPGGITIIVENNNIYGTDPDDIADAIGRKLNNMIRI
jgi:hypothetical protein